MVLKMQMTEESLSAEARAAPMLEFGRLACKVASVAERPTWASYGGRYCPVDLLVWLNTAHSVPSAVTS